MTSSSSLVSEDLPEHHKPTNLMKHEDKEVQVFTIRKLQLFPAAPGLFFMVNSGRRQQLMDSSTRLKHIVHQITDLSLDLSCAPWQITPIV
jgi:hypothetical protein